MRGVPDTAETSTLAHWTVRSTAWIAYVARKKIVERLEATRACSTRSSRRRHVVPHGDRSGAVLEPFLTDQWYVDAKTLAQPAIEAVRERKTVFVPPQWEATFFNWMDNIQPWCISRQIWWGHQIPAWYGPDGQESSSPRAKTTWSPTRWRTTPRSRRSRPKRATIIAGRSGSRRARFATDYLHRDEDVLDTWFSSALWPFSTLGWPDETPELKRFYPTSTLVTGFDIIFFWVARMMMMGLHFMKEVPFHDVYIHALGARRLRRQDVEVEGQRHRSAGSDRRIRRRRFALHARGDGSARARYQASAQRVEGYRNFATKLWNAARFAEINGCAHDPDFDPHHAKETLNRWIAHETAKTGREVTAAIEAYKFNEAASAIYRLSGTSIATGISN